MAVIPNMASMVAIVENILHQSDVLLPNEDVLRSENETE